jgi:polysaccharide deacetylase family protein (PEP-CTERM system associated)
MVHPAITSLRTPGRAPRVLTVDVEDWFHVCGDDYYSDPRRWSSFVPRVERNMRNLFDRLDGGGHRATFFFLGWVARRYPQLVVEAARRGHEIGVHGDMHRRADELTLAEFRDDLNRARDAIEKAGGGRPTCHRAAEWSIRHPAQNTLATVAEEGFTCDASVTPIPPLGAADNQPGPYRVSWGTAALLEMPPLTGRGFGRTLPMGGSWPFRMFSASRVREVEDGFRDAGWPAVFTFHPWEFDAAHPSMEGLAPIGKLVHFYRLGALSERFERWLEQDRAVALRDACRQLEAVEAA